jgi:hypothetical protein
MKPNSYNWLLQFWGKAFSIDEIRNSVALQWVFGATVFSYYVTFSSWIGNNALTLSNFFTGNATCRPYFQDCYRLIFLESLPNGYSQTTLYMVFFACMLSAVYWIYRKDWVLAQISLLPLFLWHFLGVFVLTDSLSGNYDYYLSLFSIVLLFLPYKTFFLQLVIVLLYFLAGSIKIHEGWVLGTYFSSLQSGIPIFPEWSTPIWTNLVICMEVIGAWFLLSKKDLYRYITIGFFICFHLYSGILVEYHYPSIVLPTLLILFGLFYEAQRIPITFRSIYGWILIACMLVGQSVALIIPGDVKLTLEGNKYGVYMFEANHQCISNYTVFKNNGETRMFEKKYGNARTRCDPYHQLQYLHFVCRYDPTVSSIAWKFHHSINGGPFYTIVDVQNACQIEYKPFSHNVWIKSEYDNPPIIGYPLENWYE